MDYEAIDLRLTRREVLRRGGACAGALLLKGTLAALAADAASNAAGTPATWADQASLHDLALTDGRLDYHEFPTLASDGNGRAWVAALRRLPNGRETITLHARGAHDGQWQLQPPLTPDEGCYEFPRLACAANGEPMAVWIENRGDQWLIQSALHGGGAFGSSLIAVDGPGRAANPALAAAPGGVYWLSWEAYDQGRFRIMLKAWREGIWGEAVAVTDGQANAYDPALAVAPDGTVWLAYSQADGPHHHIYLIRFDPSDGRADAPIPVAIGGALEAMPNINSHPTLYCDPESRLWISWETPTAPQKLPSYFGRRRCPVVRYAEGRFEEVVAEPTAGAEASNDHLPLLVPDGQGRPWLFTRRWHPRRKWDLAGGPVGGATAPIGLLAPDDMGRCHAPAVAPAGGPNGGPHGGPERLGGFLIAWQADNFIMEQDWFQTMPEDFRCEIHAGRLDSAAATTASSAPAPSPEPRLRPWIVERHHAAGTGRPSASRRTIHVDGEEYTLLFGNLHEHSNISRCWADGSDGELDDNYRYGIEVEGYDFVALTDHCFDLNEPRWRWSLRTARFYDAPGHFVALPAYEWTLSAAMLGIKDHVPPGTGHRNLIFPDDADAAKMITARGAAFHCKAEGSDRVDRLWRTMHDRGVRAITIPHHPVDLEHPMSWEFHDPQYEAVVEIYQCRGSAEYRGAPGELKAAVTAFQGCHVSDALARGYKLGFIGSGDHNAMGIGLAAVYVKEVSRAGVFEALQARRCYATMGDKLFLDVRVNDRPMGETVRAAGAPRLTARIEGVRPLAEVVVFRGRETIYRAAGDKLGKLAHELDLVDQEFPGNGYYYVRAIQDNDQIAWSSPIWVER